MTTCYYCKQLTYKAKTPEAKNNPEALRTRDHYEPKRFTKVVDKGLVVVACYKCNSTKGYQPPEVFEHYLRNKTATTLKEMREEFDLFVYNLTRLAFQVGLKEANRGR